jgi:hypothetical protein
MYLGSPDIKQNVKGTFKKYHYKVTLKRTDKTSRFGCFKGNENKTHTYIDFLYARNDKDFLDMLTYWEKFYNDDTWKYDSIQTPNKLMSIDEVVIDFYENKKRGVIKYSDDFREIIQ